MAGTAAGFCFFSDELFHHEVCNPHSEPAVFPTLETLFSRWALTVGTASLSLLDGLKRPVWTISIYWLIERPLRAEPQRSPALFEVEVG